MVRRESVRMTTVQTSATITTATTTLAMARISIILVLIMGTITPMLTVTGNKNDTDGY